MRKLFSYPLFLAIVSSLALIGCGDDGDSEEKQTQNSPTTGAFISLSENKLSFTEKAEQKSVTVLSNVEWQVNGIPAWLMVTPSKGNGEVLMNISVSANGELDSRNAIISFSGGGVVKSLEIEQLGNKKDVSVSKDKLSFGSSKSSEKVLLTAEGYWEVMTSADWCTCNKTEGTGNSQLAISVTENTLTTARNATVTITTEKVSLQIDVTQEAGSELIVSPTSLSKDCFGCESWDELSFNVKTDGVWKIEDPTDDWIDHDHKSLYSGNEKVKVWVKKNPTQSERIAVLKVVKGEQQKEVEIIQSAAQPPMVTEFKIGKKLRDGFEYTLYYKTVDTGSADYGVCYSTTNATPTVDDGSQRGETWKNEGKASKLTGGIDYYVRGYVKSSVGTTYTDAIVVSFGYPNGDDNPTPSYIKKK